MTHVLWSVLGEERCVCENSILALCILLVNALKTHVTLSLPLFVAVLLGDVHTAVWGISVV